MIFAFSASHVRRVRIPSGTSEVDQFLDDLFSPVLGGNLDDLSDARSLASAIRGGGHIETTRQDLNSDENQFLQTAMAQNQQIQKQLLQQNIALQKLLNNKIGELYLKISNFAHRSSFFIG